MKLQKFALFLCVKLELMWHGAGMIELQVDNSLALFD
jgi:hypothetical protein